MSQKFKIKVFLPAEKIEKLIFVIRGQKVIQDVDLAHLYGVSTKAFNQAVKRNQHRFPDDFAFRLSAKEVKRNRSQIVTASKRNIRYRPRVFTEYGCFMAANVLNSQRAVAMSVYVVRAFVRLRETFVSNQILEKRLAEIEKTLLHHNAALRDLYEKIRPLLLPPTEKPKRKIGFCAD